jgi:hypothetical protein
VVELIERRSPQVGTGRHGEAEARQVGKQLAIAAQRPARSPGFVHVLKAVVTD